MNTKLLKQKILDLAIRGKLSQQLKSDGTARELLEQISSKVSSSSSTLSSPRRRGSPSSSAAKTIIPLDKSEAPFEIPANWEWVRLGDVASDFQYGSAEKSQVEGKVAVLRMGNINRQGQIDYGDLVYTSNDAEIAKYLLNKNDVLFNRTNSPEWVGKTAIYKGEIPAIYAGYIIRIRPHFNSDYLNYLMCSDYERNWSKEVKTDGVHQSNINAQKLIAFAIPLPPLAEQQRIVAKIEEAFAEIDAIEKNKELLKTHIKQTRQKILDLAIHGKLVPQDENDEPASVLLERITRDNPHYEKLTDVPFEIPESWEWVKLGDVVEINPKNKLDDNLEVSFIPMNLIEAGYSNRHKQESRFWKDVKKGFTHFAENDVALAKISPCFENRKSAIMKNLKNGYGAGTTELFVFRSSNVMLPSYLLWIIKSDDFIQAGTGNFSGVVGQQRLSREIVENYHIALPPLAEQKRIVNKIEEVFASLDEISLHLV
ncbi:MAG: restriction endonuclease subunit S [Fibrobacter sp.]|nr:restriction endonuclease subunit S [Fibrobacter sp.]